MFLSKFSYNLPKIAHFNTAENSSVMFSLFSSFLQLWTLSKRPVSMSLVLFFFFLYVFLLCFPYLSDWDMEHALKACGCGLPRFSDEIKRPRGLKSWKPSRPLSLLNLSYFFFVFGSFFLFHFRVFRERLSWEGTGLL